MYTVRNQCECSATASQVLRRPCLTLEWCACLAPSRQQSPHCTPLGVWNLHLLPLETGATCLDGSRAGFYYVPSPSEHPMLRDSWVFFFEGGGWCVGDEDCSARAKTSRGSSRTWQNQTAVGGILNRCCYFTRFCQFHRVYLKSCDGRGFAGNERYVTAQNAPATTISAGQAIVKATIEALVASYGLAKKPVSMLISGCSAGGRAALLYAPAIRRMMLSRGVTFTRFKVMGIASIFFPHTVLGPFASRRAHGSLGSRELGLNQTFLTDDRVLSPFAEHMRTIAEASDMQMGDLATTSMADCRSRMPPAESWRCSWGMEPVELMPYDIPVFLVQSVFDLWQTSCVLAASASSVFEGGCSSGPGWSRCIPWGQSIRATQPLATCSRHQQDRMNGFQLSNLAVLAQSQALHRPGYGGFFHACNDHCTTSDANVRLEINNVSMRDATQRWCALVVAPNN